MFILFRCNNNHTLTQTLAITEHPASHSHTQTTVVAQICFSKNEKCFIVSLVNVTVCFFPWSPFDLVCFLFALLWEQYFVFALLVFVFCFVCVCFFNVPEHCLHLFINVFCDTDLIPLCSICRWFQQSRFMCKCISQESLFHLRFCLLYFCFFLNLTQSMNRNKCLCRNCFHWELWVSFVSSSVLYLLSGFVCVVQSFKSICLFVFVCLCFILGNCFCFCFRKFLLHHFSFLRLLFMFSYARCALGGAHHHYSAFFVQLFYTSWNDI